LEPDNVNLRLMLAQCLEAMKRTDDAIGVLEGTLRIAPPEMRGFIQGRENDIREAEKQRLEAEKQDREWRAKEEEDRKREGVENAKDAVPAPVAEAPQEKPGPRRSAIGVIKDVQCTDAYLSLKLQGASKTLRLHARNYYKVAYSATGFEVRGKLEPCTGIANYTAKIDYYESLKTPGEGQIIAVELRK
jgi:hypothetical protein